MIFVVRKCIDCQGSGYKSPRDRKLCELCRGYKNIAIMPYEGLDKKSIGVGSSNMEDIISYPNNENDKR